MRRCLLALVFVIAAACGSDNNNNVAPTKNNGSNTTNNETSNQTNNDTGGSNNGSNNGTAGSNNATAGTHNNTTATNNTNNNGLVCDPLEPGIGECDPLCQSGCDVGQHCLVESEPDVDATSVCAPSGLGLQNDPCAADTECALGLHCRSVGGGERTCLNYCNPDGRPGCPGGHACVRLQADNRIGACVPVVDECDPIPTDTCADPDECYDTIQGRRCLPAGDVELDAACTRSGDCVPGLRCIDVMDIGQVCKPLCDPDGPADQCADGMCRALRSPDGTALSWGACF